MHDSITGDAGWRDGAQLKKERKKEGINFQMEMCLGNLAGRGLTERMV